jgi:DNA uptake protein ComE-like DNA-binding protein
MTTRQTRPAFTTLLVFGVIVFAGAALAMMQAAASAQSGAGREALARVRAQWAARAGVEATLAAIEAAALDADDDAFAVLDASQRVAEGALRGASWTVGTQRDGRVAPGAEDEGGKLNLARLTPEALLNIRPFMTEDTADAILDWLDADDDTRPLGAEIGYYQSATPAVEPRNTLPRTILELELIAGVTPEDLRGEDWNLNGVLDAGEDDGDETFPPDNGDGVLDAGWSGLLTVYSVERSTGPSGKEKLLITAASAAEIAARTGASAEQAQAIEEHVGGQRWTNLGDFIRTPLPQLAQQTLRDRRASRAEIRRAGRLPALSREQLAALVEECSELPPQAQRFVPARLNINTCEARTIESIPEIEPGLADAIIGERSSRGKGFASIVDLLDVPGMSAAALADAYPLLTTRSAVYRVTCRGRDDKTGMQREVVAIIDASTVPATLREVRTR